MLLTDTDRVALMAAVIHGAMQSTPSYAVMQAFLIDSAVREHAQRDLGATLLSHRDKVASIDALRRALDKILEDSPDASSVEIAVALVDDGWHHISEKGA